MPDKRRHPELRGAFSRSGTLHMSVLIVSYSCLTKRQNRELILNYFRAQKVLSSGVVEGLNNKAKVTMRKSYGFRTFRCLELTLYHSVGKLPEQESTHDFFRRTPVTGRFRKDVRCGAYRVFQARPRR
jgi:hypothetical protein